MKCPYCYVPESKVIDSRASDNGGSIRRRRECVSCGRKFTTYERVENMVMMVIKKDGSRQSFDRNKVANGIRRACEKRPISMEQVEGMIDTIEAKLQSGYDREVTSQHIGELVMELLKDVDKVAYIRFASVYKNFEDADTFMEELDRLRKNQA